MDVLSSRTGRGPQDGHGPLLRPRRVHRARGPARPGGAAASDAPLLRARRGGDRGARRHRREVRRRRGHGRLRRAGRARGRRAASRARGASPSRSASPSSIATSDVHLEVRIGVNTGEVVTGDPSAGHGFVSGDAVNVGKRLEQAAAPGRDRPRRVDATASSSTPCARRRSSRSTLKGKAEETVAFRLESVDPAATAIPRRDDTPLVGQRARARASALRLRARPPRRAPAS